MVQYREEIKKIKENIRARLERGEQFHLTRDKWTSVRGRKFLNVHVKTIDHKFHCPGNKITGYIISTLR